MAKMYDALKRAETEGRRDYSSDSLDGSSAGPSARALREKLIGAYRSIEAALPGVESKAVVFVSATPGEGTSALVREFASLAAANFLQKVIVVDLAPGGSNRAEGERRPALDEVVVGTANLEDAIDTPSKSGVASVNLTWGESPGSAVLNHPIFRELIGELRGRYELVLFDAPPMEGSSEAALVVSHVDGVVLVVEAQKTRWQTLERARDTIEHQGGTILGVILNRRKFHIPKALYKRL